MVKQIFAAGVLIAVIGALPVASQAAATVQPVFTTHATLSPIGFSTTRGTATLTYNPHTHATTVGLLVSHLSSGMHLTMISNGSCGSGGVVRYHLMPLIGPGTRFSRTVLHGKPSGTLHLNVQSEGQKPHTSVTVACGQIL